ncbi:class I SAM-dependent methyltransferase [bacterium]|nr:class I SAM-dependent methyltransferase [bacterium]RQV92206.1 MAG: class I SAM-dependent methyltransferase [bacterium]
MGCFSESPDGNETFIDSSLVDLIRSIKPDWSYFKEGMSDYSYICYISLYLFATRYCEGKQVLDAASGIGFGSYFLTQTAKRVIGIDIDLNSLSYAVQRYHNKNLNFLLTDVTENGFSSSSFDVVVSIETFEHLIPEKAMVFLQEIFRLLKPGGVLIISTPNRRVNRKISRNPTHINEMEVKAFFDLIRRVFPDCQPFYQRKNVLQSMKPFYFVVRIDRLKLRSLFPRFVRNRIRRLAAPRLYSDMPGLLDQLKVHEASCLDELEDAVIQIAVCRKS